MTNTAEPARCKRPGCGRKLTAPASIAAGYSKRCLKLAALDAIRDAIAPYSQRQQDKALALIASGGIRPTADLRVWLADSSDRTTIYTIRDGKCPCAAADHDKTCYHRIAQRAIQAVSRLAA